MLDVINFHVYIQCQLLSQMHFPKRQLPRGIFPNDNFRRGNFPTEQFPKQQLPKSCLATVLSPLATALSAHCSLRLLRKPYLTLGKFSLGKLHIWEVAPSKIVIRENTQHQLHSLSKLNIYRLCRLYLSVFQRFRNHYEISVNGKKGP